MLHIIAKHKNGPVRITAREILESPFAQGIIAKHGIRFIYFVTALTAAIESSNNPHATNKYDVWGMWQMKKSTINAWKKRLPSLPSWSEDPRDQLQYFLAAFNEYMTQAKKNLSQAAARGLTSGLRPDSDACKIYAFRVTYHLWSFRNYDKVRENRTNVLLENSPLIFAANAFVEQPDVIFETITPFTISRSSFQDKTWLYKELLTAARFSPDSDERIV